MDIDKKNKCNKVVEEWNEKHPDEVCFFEHPQLMEMMLTAAGCTFEDEDNDAVACEIVDKVMAEWKIKLNLE